MSHRLSRRARASRRRRQHIRRNRLQLGSGLGRGWPDEWPLDPLVPRDVQRRYVMAYALWGAPDWVAPHPTYMRALMGEWLRTSGPAHPLPPTRYWTATEAELRAPSRSNAYSEALLADGVHYSGETISDRLRALLRATCASCEATGLVGGQPCPDCARTRT